MNYGKTTDIDGFLSKISCKLIGNAYNIALSKFPNLVQIETTNACNAKCLICPHRNMKRLVKQMDESVYTKIIDECTKYNCANIHLHNFGEPLLDKRLVERVQHAKEKGIKAVTIFSNGSLLDAQKAEALMDAGLDEIKISFDGATKEEFEKIRYPLHFDRVINNVKELVKIRNAKGSRLKVVVTCCSTGPKSEIVRSLENIVDKFSFGKIHNWANQDFVHDAKTKIRKPCSRVWRTFTVLSTGFAALCCLDYEGQIIVGNVNTTSIFEIWHNDNYKKLRLHHKNARQHKISICSACTKSFW